jgi:hypothetical protein
MHLRQFLIQPRGPLLRLLYLLLPLFHLLADLLQLALVLQRLE